MSSLSAQKLYPEHPRVNMRALNYRNDRVVARLVENDGMSQEEAEQLFSDTLKVLALADGPVKLSPSPRIDLGWHNFILHTRDYAAFCDDCFGRFIHHEPGSGLTFGGPMLNMAETADLARTTFGEISPNWGSARGATCGSGGC